MPQPEPPAFFTRDGGRFIPEPHARSWWVPTMTHGRLLGGLLARALEIEHGRADLQFCRLTVDLFRNAPLEPLHVTTTRIREGYRIRVAEATVLAEIGPVAKATAVQLRRGEQPSGDIPATPRWDAPDPTTLPTRPDVLLQRWQFSADGDPTRRRVWLQEVCQLVAGEPLSPFVRAALAADMASPLAHGSEDDLEFINADYTLYLSRLPVGEYIGLESSGHRSEAGVAVGHCTMHDRMGPIGYSATAAVANPGVRAPRRPHTAESAAH